MNRFDYRGSFVGVQPKRWIHGHGFAFRAKFTGSASAAWLQNVEPFFPATDHSYDAIVRCSPFVPLPPPVPEALCLAIRIKHGCGLGQHQDLTFFSTPRCKLLRHVPVPRIHARGTTFTSAETYLVNPPVGNANRVFFGLHFEQDPPVAGAESAFAELVSTLRPSVSLELLTALPFGDWLSAGQLSDFQPDVPWGNAVRYRPGNTSSHLALTRLGRWRDSLYRGLQR
jgi:hypothetical protein